MKKQEDSITIGQDSFEDILAGRTGNPIADEETLEILRAAIKAGAIVLLTKPHCEMYQLTLSTANQFQYVPF